MPLSERFPPSAGGGGKAGVPGSARPSESRPGVHSPLSANEICREHNFVKPHRALKFGKELRTPAMQEGLARRRLSFRAVFCSHAIIRPRLCAVLLEAGRPSLNDAAITLGYTLTPLVATSAED